MSSIWNPQPWEVLDSWVKAILEEASDDLNDWESHFVEEISIKIANRWPLTIAQERKLEDIYAEKTK
jgi:hypothetical protein